jgi:hypothetical protein
MAKVKKPDFKLNLCVHWSCLWIEGEGVCMSQRKLKKFCKLLLDQGFPIRGYWKDIDYRSIDPRITNEGGRI